MYALLCCLRDLCYCVSRAPLPLKFAASSTLCPSCFLHVCTLHLAPRTLQMLSFERDETGFGAATKEKKGDRNGYHMGDPPEKLPSFTQPAEAIRNNRKQGPGPRNIENDRHDPRILPPELQIDSQPCHSTSVSEVNSAGQKISTRIRSGKNIDGRRLEVRLQEFVRKAARKQGPPYTAR